MNNNPDKDTSPAKKKRGGNRVIIIVVAAWLFFCLASVFFLFYNFRTSYKRNLNFADTYHLITILDEAVRLYEKDVGTYPSSLQGLLENIDHAEKWDGPYLKPALPRDPWGNEFHYVFPGKHGEFDIYSLGSDGKEGDGRKGERMEPRNLAGDLGNWDVVEPKKTAPSFYDFELTTRDGQVIRTADQDASRTDEEIHAFRTSEYGVTFPQMAKPKSRSDWPAIYSALGPVKWYFTKYVIGRDGKVARCFGPDATFDPADTMDELERCIRSLLDVPAEEKRDGKLEIEAGDL